MPFFHCQQGAGPDLTLLSGWLTLCPFNLVFSRSLQMTSLVETLELYFHLQLIQVWLLLLFSNKHRSQSEEVNQQAAMCRISTNKNLFTHL